MSYGMMFSVWVLAFLLGVIIDQLRAINRHHKGLKIFLERWFKEFKNDS